MSVHLHFNSAVTDAPVGNSLFTCAEKLGIPVPTSCNKQGKCKECVIEVTEGMDCLSRPGPEEKHLKGEFPAVLLHAHRAGRGRPCAATPCGAAR